MAAGGAVLALSACVGPFDTRDFMSWSPPPELVHEIESIRLEERSLEPPVHVADAFDDLELDLTDPPDTMELSLGDVRAASLENNLDLRVQLVNPTLSQYDVDAEEAKFEAVFTASARRSLIDSPTATPTLEGSQTETDSYAIGVRVPLRTGGTASVDFPFSRFDSNFALSLAPQTFDTNLRFSISQPLLRGAGNRTNTHSIRVVKRQHQITEARTKLEAIRILANADRAYWRLYAAQRELEVRHQQYELAVTQLDRARRRVDAGAAPQIEILRAQSGVAQRVEAIIIAQNLIRLRARNLKRIMNRDDLPMDSATAITITTAPDPLGLELDPAELAEYALQNRMEMLEMELQLAIDASTIDFQENARLPLVTLDYTYNVNGLATGWRRSFGQIPDHSFEDQIFGVSAEIPIGNEAAKARVHRAVLQRIQRLSSRDLREAAIRQEVYDATDQIRQNWQRILAARQDALLSGETYEAERRQFEVGARTSTDVLDAATRLADAQSREILALADYQIAQIDLAFATGTLLGYERVRWDSTELDEVAIERE
ncbi:MAG: TolC family protein [Planctomycetes bacterium]|nr:TolC family protein [Planctomycetota bacterium]